VQRGVPGGATAPGIQAGASRRGHPTREFSEKSVGICLKNKGKFLKSKRTKVHGPGHPGDFGKIWTND